MASICLYQFGYEKSLSCLYQYGLKAFGSICKSNQIISFFFSFFILFLYCIVFFNLLLWMWGCQKKQTTLCFII